MKQKRQAAIIELIGLYQIGTQEEMLSHLRDSGFAVTQATVSRDIRELGLYKVLAENGKTCYRTVEAEARRPRYGNIMNDSVLAIHQAGNLVVLRTHPGLAAAVAAFIDAQKNFSLLGSVAGDDTVLVIAETPAQAATITSGLRMLAGRA